MIRIELDESLDTMDNGFSPCRGSETKLKGGQKPSERTRGAETERQGGGGAKEDFGDSNGANAVVLLTRWDETT